MVTKTKREVAELKLEKFVTLPSDDTNFQDWWKELDDDDDVEVRYPHEQHGLRSKVSNRAKTDIMNDFLRFVENNSNKWSSSRYYILLFAEIQKNRTTKTDFDQKALSCLVNEFNRAQKSEGKSTARQLLKRHRPKVALHPKWTIVILAQTA